MSTTKSKTTGTNGNAKTAAKDKKDDNSSKIIKVSQPKYKVMTVPIIGQAGYVQNRITQSSVQKILDKQTSSQKGKQQHDARVLEQEFHEAYYRLEDGGFGIPVAALKGCMVHMAPELETESGFQVYQTTLAKCLRVLPDGFDTSEGTPLVRLETPGPQQITTPTRPPGQNLQIRVRALFPAGWRAVVRIKYDSERLTPDTVYSLLFRAGEQIGIGDGRQFTGSDSKKSKTGGMGWGYFMPESEIQEEG